MAETGVKLSELADGGTLDGTESLYAVKGGVDVKTTPAEIVKVSKDASGGNAGLTGFKLNLKNVAGTIISFFTNTNTDARTYTLPDKDITVAGIADITKTQAGLGNVDNTSDVNKPVSTAQAIAIGLKADQSTTYTKTETDALVVGLWDDRGSFNASVNTYPTTGGSGTAGAIKKGDIWTISVIATSGALLGYAVGATVRALVDTPAQTGTNWSAEQNLTGYVPENSANKDVITGNETSEVKYPHIKAILDYFTQSKLFTILGISTLSGSNTGDETNARIDTLINAATAQGTTTPADTDKLVLGKTSTFNSWTIANFKAWLATLFNTKLIQVSSVSVLTTGWTLVSGIYEYSISNANILSTSIVDIIPENIDSATVLLAELYPKTTSSAGAVKIYANYVPLAAFTVTLNIY